MKRWRPRARGRATRIRKRTCHITIILARYTPEELEEMRNRAELKGSSMAPSAAEARRRRVEKSKEAANDGEDGEAEDLDVEAQDVEEETEDLDVEGQDVEEETEDLDVEGQDEDDESSPYGEGSASAGDDGSQPSEEYQIKGKVSSKIYHPPESPFYSRTKADVWFTTSEAAEKAGFSLPASMQENNEDQPSSDNNIEETDEVKETEEGE